VDGVTRQPILSPLSVSGEGTTWVRNRRGLYVLTAAPGFEEHQVAMETPPINPAVESIALGITVQDQAGIYLSRRQIVRLPRDPDPAHAEDGRSLFQPIESRLYLSPAAPTSSAWAVIRASIAREGGGQRVGGALIRVLRVADGQVLARGLSDARGEALVPVPGIPVTTWEAAPGPVMGTEVDAQVEVVVNPFAGNVPDPDALEANRAMLPRGEALIRLASGRTVVCRVTVAIP
jgi:hypothetical protein